MDHYNDRFRDSYGHDREDDRDVSKAEINRFAQNAFKQSANAMGQADIGKTTKLFGLFEVDAGLAVYLSSMYNIASDYATKLLQPRTYDLTRKYAQKAGVSGGALNRTAAMTTIAVTVAAKTAGYIGPVFEAYSKQRKERIALAHELAPVLDDLKGKHTVGALYSVAASENEVIYAQRKRIGKIAHSANFQAIVDLSVNSGVGLALDVPHMSTVLQHKGSEKYKDIIAPIEAKKRAEEKGEVDGTKNEIKHLLRGFMNVSSSQISERVKKSNEYKLKQTMQPYSAYEMIKELEDQVTSNPKASSYQVPKSFAGGSSRESYSLEEYLMRVVIQHQKDMAEISPDHTEIREALKEDLAAVVKPMAEAIRKGDMSALSLVRLVGEGKIIRNKGRALASADEVETLISRDAPKQTTYVHIDPKEYYKEAAFTREDLKAALKALDGEEKQHLASMIPDAVLEEAGMGAHEVKELRAAVMKGYERMLTDAIVGLDSKSEDELKKIGLAQKEIEFLHKAFSSIEKEGVKAVHELRCGPTNENGIERLITNMAVSQTVKGDKTYLGKVIGEGHKKYEEMQAGEEGGDEKRSPRRGGPKDRMRPSVSREEAEEMDDDEKSEGRFTEREGRRAKDSRDSQVELD